MSDYSFDVHKNECEPIKIILDGRDGADGLPGPEGPAGHTPEKGVDYWTEEDKQEIVNSVSAVVVPRITSEAQARKQADIEEANARATADAGLHQRIGAEEQARRNAIAVLEGNIPTKTSQLTNDSGFVTGSVVRTVNHTAPDENGNVDVQGGTGGVTKAYVDEQDNLIRTDVQALDDKIKDLELFKFPNATIVGEPIIDNGQVSGFSSANYLQFPFIVDVRNRPFEIDVCFTTGSDVTTQQNILDSQFGLALAIMNGKGIMAMSSNGTTWDIGQATGVITIATNTTYYAKISWDGSVYKTAISTDGTTYVDDMSLTDSRGLFPKTIFIGGSYGLFGAGTDHPFKGTINLNNCKLSIDGLVVWVGMDDAGLATRADVSLSNIDADGIQKIKDIAGGGEGGVTKEYVDSENARQDEAISEINATLFQLPKDVQINGTSILDENKVANIPIAKSSAVGVVRANGAYGVELGTNGNLVVTRASETEIDGKSDKYHPIVPYNLDYAIASALSTKDLQNRVDVLEKMSKGILYDFVTQTVEGTQNIPKGSHLADLQKLEGKSVVFNQYIATVNKASTVYGITREAVRTADLLAIKYTGTSENSTNFTASSVDKTTINWVEGHKMYYTLGISLPTGCHISLSSTDKTSSIVTVATATNHSFGVFITEGTTVDFICYPQCIDLTRMFGAGNEPTVEQFEAMFPNDYYPYNIGELQSVNNTTLTNKGKNLLKQEFVLNGGYSKNVGDTINPYTNTNVSFDVKSNVTTFTATSQWGGGAFKSEKLEVGKSYRLNFKNTSSNASKLRASTYMIDENNIVKRRMANIDSTYSGGVFTVEGGEKYFVISIATSEATTVDIENISIYSDTTKEDYVPYKEPQTIPLAFVGKSAGTVRDELDLVNKKYIQRVGVVDLGSLIWTKGGTDNDMWYSADLKSTIKLNSDDVGLICSKNWDRRTYVQMNINKLVGYGYRSSDNTLRIYDTEYVSYTSNAFKSAMQGVMLYYELAEPIITDVSTVIDSFNVEGNGTIEFDSSIPVRNTIEYLRYLNEV